MSHPAAGRFVPDQKISYLRTEYTT